MLRKYFKLNRRQRAYKPQIFPSFSLQMEKLPSELSVRSKPSDGCDVVMQRHAIAQSSGWENSTSEVEILHSVFRKYTNRSEHGGTHARAAADGNINFLLKIPMRLLCCVMISERRPPTSLWSHSLTHTHQRARTAIFRVMRY